MRQWVTGYKKATYTRMDPIALDVPGPIRKIISGYYMAAGSSVPNPLAPEVIADAAGDVQISDPATGAGKRAVEVYTPAATIEDLVVFLFIEVELEVPGTHRPITD